MQQVSLHDLNPGDRAYLTFSLATLPSVRCTVQDVTRQYVNVGGTLYHKSNGTPRCWSAAYMMWLVVPTPELDTEYDQRHSMANMARAAVEA